MVEKAIFNILTNDAGLIALQADRVYPMIAPQGVVAPFMIVSRESQQDRSPTQVGISGIDIGHFRIRCYADTYLAAAGLAEELRLSFTRQKGTFAGIGIQDVFYIDEWDDIEQLDEGGEKYLFIRDTLWQIPFNEATS